jgi:TonB family protein
MLNLAFKIFGALILAVAVNFGMAWGVAYLQQGLRLGQASEAKAQHKVIAEYRKPKTEPPKETPRPVRPLNAAPKAQGGMERLNFDFAPDLGVTSAVGAVLEGSADNQEAMVFDEGQTDEDAQALRMNPPQFPEEARDAGASGAVSAVFVIDEQGRVGNIQIRQSPHPALSREMLRTLQSWKFKPARNQGIPVKVRKKVTLDFALES